MDHPHWLGHAWAELGQKEVAGTRDNPHIRAFYKDVGHCEVKHDEVPWCAAFVGACLERAGLSSTGSLMARSYLAWGVGEKDARLGAVAVLSRGRDTSAGHVGFLVGLNESTLWLLGGNQSDGVSVAAYDRSRLLGLRWPGVGRASVSGGAGGLGVFEVALKHVLEMEGGFTDDPADPGGPTNKGITLGVLAAWRKVTLNGKTRRALVSQLKTISDETVREIYRRRYWRLAHCAEFSPPLALMHFDAAVNHGVGGAMRMLQQVVGVDVDGEIGPETRAAVRRRDVGKTVKAYADIRRTRYKALPHFWRFGRGWLRRVDTTLSRSMGMLASRGFERDFGKSSGDNGKGDDMMFPTDDRGGVGTKWWGESVTIWGALITAAATVVPVLASSVGVEIGADLVRQVGTDGLGAAQALIGLAGTVLTIFGRLRASQRLIQRQVRINL